MMTIEELEPAVRVLAIGVQGFRNRRPRWGASASKMARYVMATVYESRTPPSVSLTFVRKGGVDEKSSFSIGSETGIAFNYNPSKKRWSTESISGVRLEQIDPKEVERRVAAFYSPIYPVQRVDGESLRYAKALIEAERRTLHEIQVAADRIAPPRR